jgi:hypothetical protein
MASGVDGGIRSRRPPFRQRTGQEHGPGSTWPAAKPTPKSYSRAVDPTPQAADLLMSNGISLTILPRRNRADLWAARRRARFEGRRRENRPHRYQARGSRRRRKSTTRWGRSLGSLQVTVDFTDLCAVAGRTASPAVHGGHRMTFTPGELPKVRFQALRGLTEGCPGSGFSSDAELGAGR